MATLLLFLQTPHWWWTHSLQMCHLCHLPFIFLIWIWSYVLPSWIVNSTLICLQDKVCLHKSSQTYNQIEIMDSFALTSVPKKSSMISFFALQNLFFTKIVETNLFLAYRGTQSASKCNCSMKPRSYHCYKKQSLW